MAPENNNGPGTMLSLGQRNALAAFMVAGGRVGYNGLPGVHAASVKALVRMGLIGRERPPGADPSRFKTEYSYDYVVTPKGEAITIQDPDIQTRIESLRKQDAAAKERRMAYALKVASTFAPSENVIAPNGSIDMAILEQEIAEWLIKSSPLYI